MLRPNPHLYQINTYAWLERLSARRGRTIHLGEVPDSEWDAIAAMGFDIVWLMGVWRRSAISRQLDIDNHPVRSAYAEALPNWTPADIIGSPYSVAAYEPDARIGSWDDLDAARSKLRQRKMALFLDFVGNHTAFDHPWTYDHPEYYVQGTKDDIQRDPASFYQIESVKGTVYVARGRDPYFPAWDDVAQLNHFSMEMRAAQLDGLRRIATHCDGVRCDMAMLQLSEIFERIWRWRLGNTPQPSREFWAEARAAVPGLTLLAEAYWGTEGRLIELGFSFVYDKGFYDVVRDEKLGDIHASLEAPLGQQSHMARFMENHDEPRCAAVFGNDRLVAAATLMGTLPGMRFYQQGEELGFKVRTPIELRIVAEEAPDPFRRDFFAKLFAATHEDAFHTGQWSLLNVASDNEQTGGNILAYQWRSQNAWKLVVVNLSRVTSQGRIHLDGAIDEKRSYNFTDAMDGTVYLRQGAELHQAGLFVRRGPYEGHIFDVASA
jgi:hypothetical protein